MAVDEFRQGGMLKRILQTEERDGIVIVYRTVTAVISRVLRQEKDKAGFTLQCSCRIGLGKFAFKGTLGLAQERL